MIGIFDSGVGGLSVYKELKKVLPNVQFIYFADQKNSPYGIKSTKEIRELTLKALKFLASKNVGCIVIACNTATVAGLDYYRKQIQVPIIGLVPAIKPASKKYNRIAILATETTARSKKLRQYIDEFASGKKVNIVSNNSLVNVVENSDFKSSEIASVGNHLKELSVDVVVLGCTHFVFLIPYLKKYLPEVEFFDSGIAVAIQTKKIYKDRGSGGTDLFYTTGKPRKFKDSIHSLLRLDPDIIEVKVDVSTYN